MWLNRRRANPKERRKISEPVWLIGGFGVLLLAGGIGPVLLLGHPRASFASPEDVATRSGSITEVATGRAIRRRRGVEPRNRSWCSVEITYTVDGVDYTIYDTDRWLRRSDAERCADRSSRGTRRRVHYLRSDPSVAYMSREYFGNWPYLAMAFVFLTPVGGLLFYFAWYLHKPSPNAT